MDSRERTFMSLDFEEPDRVPRDLWISSGFEAKALAGLGMTRVQLLDAHDIDLRYIEGPRYIGPPMPQHSDGLDEDIWGVVRRAVTLNLDDGSETYKEVHTSPLAGAASVDDVEGYGHWPSPDWFDYGDIEAQCDTIRDQGRVVVFMGDRLNRLAQLKPAMYLRGVEQIMLDLVERPEIARAVFGRIRAFYNIYAERIFEAARGKIDILLTGDDFGSQNGPLVSPAMWRTFLADGFAEYVGLAKSRGIRAMHHTCGSVRPIVPLMMECGLEILQSLQPEAADMEGAELKREYAGRLAFHGGISIQRTLPFGSPDDVRREVARRVEALSPGGGYILCTAHNIQADASLANFSALMAAYSACGTYA